MSINNTIHSSNNTEDQFSISNAILLINTIFTLATPILYMILKMIKKCQFGRDAFIETRSETSPTATPVNNQNLPSASQIFGRLALNRVIRNTTNNQAETSSSAESTTEINSS